ncbi:MAG: DUF2793 domain-containing protein [Pseudomonadota bacterium]
MSDTDASARLNLPFILPSQAQKHVTYNTAVERLDALVQLVLQDVDLDTPPAIPQEGQVWALGAAPTEAWAGQAGKLAQWLSSGWAFFTPQEGWQAWNKAAAQPMSFDGSAWVAAGGTQNQPGLGIATSWDANNRLAVASPASLFTHAGAGHQVKVNKAVETDTASLLFQSGFTGHAEMGLAGSTDFSVKVSPDGASWTDALVVDATTGLMGGAAVQSDVSDTGAAKLARADLTYGPGNLLGNVAEAAGVPIGAVIERGSNTNGSYVRFADGTQVCNRIVDEAGLAVDVPIGALFRSSGLDYEFPIGFASVDFVGGTLAGSDNATLTDTAWFGKVRTGSTDFNNDWAGVSIYSAVSAAAAAGETTRILLTAIGRWF